MFDRSAAVTDKFRANRKKLSMRTFSTSHRITQNKDDGHPNYLDI